MELDEQKLLTLIKSNDIFSVVYAVRSILGLGKEALIQFLQRYGRPAPAETSDIARLVPKVLDTGVEALQFPSQRKYLRFMSEGEEVWVFCGHWISIYTRRGKTREFPSPDRIIDIEV